MDVAIGAARDHVLGLVDVPGVAGWITRGGGAASRDREIVVGPVPGAAAKPQFMDVAIGAARDHVLGLVDVPGVAGWITGGGGAASRDREIVVGPVPGAAAKPQFMDVAIGAARDHVLGLVDVPGVAGWITGGGGAASRDREIVVGPVPGAAAKPQFMDVAIGAARDHVLGLVDVPGVAGWITGGGGAASRDREIVVGPVPGAAAKPQFMDVAIGPAVDHVLGLVDVPGVAGWISGGGGAASRDREIVLGTVPGAAAKPQFVDVTIRAAVDHVLGLVDVPGVAGWITRGRGAAGRDREIVVGPVPGAAAKPQFMDVAIGAARDHVLGLVDVPGVAGWITRGGGAASRDREIVVGPVPGAAAKPQFVDVTIRAAVDHVLGPVDVPGVA